MKTAYNDHIRQQEVLHSKFDIETHKNTFIDYLEVCIDPDGVIHYAIPSHTEWCIKYIAARDNVPETDVRYGNEPYTQEYQESIFAIDYVTKLSRCISVWTWNYMGIPNDAQLQTLRELKMVGLYKGDI